MAIGSQPFAPCSSLSLIVGAMTREAGDRSPDPRALGTSLGRPVGCGQPAGRPRWLLLLSGYFSGKATEVMAGVPLP